MDMLNLAAGPILGAGGNFVAVFAAISVALGFVWTPLFWAGAVLQVGHRFGLIRFGSRLDVYLPPGVAPLVAVGQTAVAGETVLADMKGPQHPRIGAPA